MKEGLSMIKLNTMEEMIINAINDFKIENGLLQLSSSKGKSYITSYPHFIAFFEKFNNTNVKKEELLYQGANMVYGWMPTILDTQKKKVKVSAVISSIENLGNKINTEDLELVSKFMNNSIVGASKLLHFIYPEKYPIWDSNICKVITGKSNYQKVQKITNYVNYYEAVHNLICKLPENLENFKMVIEEKAKYKISDVRAAELILFTNA